MTHAVNTLRRSLAILATLGLLAAANVAAVQERDVHAELQGMIERMVQALRTLSYSGNLVYLHGNQLESLELVHTVRNGEELERLVSLNGAAREVRRDQREVTCVMPDVKSVSVGERAPAKLNLLPGGNIDLEQVRGNYLLYPLGEYRVAGRPVQVLGIIPRDQYRYGYRFYLDQQTGLPLKTDMMGLDAKPIEQIMFTSVDLIEAFDPMSASDAERDGFRRIRREAPVSEIVDDSSAWVFDGLPPGFQLQLHNHREGKSGRRLDHFVLSDGLASISVYLEQDDGDGLQGQAHVGATNAWGSTLRQYQVTAVGEVPVETVRAAVQSIRFRDGAP